jgi:glycosyltransferase involved in cell wall biosynthesis
MLGQPLRLLSLGRVEEASKGVFWLPKILARLRDEHVRLTVAGDGPDRAELEHRLAPFADRVTFLGRVAPAEIPALCACHDVFLMPSRFEGFGQTIIEAMAAGCVPVVSDLSGVTDRIVAHGEDGFLFPVGDVAAAAKAVRRLDRESLLVARSSHLARSRVLGHFDLATQAAAYARLLREVEALPQDVVASCTGCERWSYPRGLQRGFRAFLPEAIKRHARLWRERFAARVSDVRSVSRST